MDGVWLHLPDGRQAGLEWPPDDRILPSGGVIVNAANETVARIGAAITAGGSWSERDIDTACTTGHPPCPDPCVKSGTVPWRDHRTIPRESPTTVKLGLQLESFTWPGGPEAIAPTLATLVRTADDAGFDSIWLMDHFFQIRGVGAPEEPMLEGMTALGFVAAHTTRARLGLLVGGVHYRLPGLWIKATTTLDVLSGGRAWLGIGAAWNQDESAALGFPFPPLAERFEMLEETLRIAHGMWSGERGTEEAFGGRHYRATRLLNSPQSLSRPRPPIMVGGGGERKTLRLVARYADACNVFGRSETIHRKYEILRAHCETVGRDPDEIERSTLQHVRLALGEPTGRQETAAQIVDRFGELADAGAQHVIVTLDDPWNPEILDVFGRDVLPAIRDL